MFPPFFACDCGVRQGENLSPLLFAIYLNDLESFLIYQHLGGITTDISTANLTVYMKLFTLLYADDIVLMAESLMDLQNGLDAFHSYCNEWKLHINVSKTKVLIFGAHTCPGRQFRIRDEIVEIVGKYKY